MEIPNFPNYLIFRNGAILYKGSLRHPPRFKQTSLYQGYVMVNLHKDKKLYRKRVHRLLAETFIPNPENKRCIDHIDRNRQNNNLSNLRWATHSENNNNRGEIKTYITKRSKTGIPYLSWSKERKKWIYKSKRYTNLEDIPFPDNTNYSHLHNKIFL